MNKKEKQLFCYLKKIKNFKEIEKVYVFGSFLNKKNPKDIDVCVFPEEPFELAWFRENKCYNINVHEKEEFLSFSDRDCFFNFKLIYEKKNVR